MVERRKYTEALKAEAVKMVIEQGMSQPEVGRLLKIPKATVGNWIAKSKKGCLSLPRERRPSGDVIAENRRLRIGLATAQMEKEILKKQQRTLQRSRYQVRVHETTATELSN